MHPFAEAPRVCLQAVRRLREGADLGADAAAPEAGEGEEAGVVPAVHEALGDQPVQLALGQHVVRDVQPRILPHQRLVRVQHLQALSTLSCPGAPLKTLPSALPK